MTELPICGVCRDKEIDTRRGLFRYCKCQFHYHEECLEAWKNSDSIKKCPICKSFFKKKIPLILKKKKKVSRKKINKKTDKKEEETEIVGVPPKKTIRSRVKKFFGIKIASAS